MGIVIDDPSFTNCCPLCWPVDETPEFILVSFSGIGMGDFWDPRLPPPPNKIFKLTNDGCSCAYSVNTGTWIVEWGTAGGRSGCDIFTTPGLVAAFTANVAGDCVFGFGNEFLQKELFQFYGGQAAISWVPPVLPISLPSIAKSAGLEVDETIRADFWPDGEKVVTRFVDHKTGSRIKIIREQEFFP